MGPHWFRSIVYDCSSGFFEGSSGFFGGPAPSAHCKAKRGESLAKSAMTYPTVNLELLVEHWLLKGSGLGPRRGGREAAEGLLEGTGAGGDEGLHSWWSTKERRRTEDNGVGALDCEFCCFRQAPASLPGFFGRISPTQSCPSNFRPIMSPVQARPLSTSPVGPVLAASSRSRPGPKT